MALLWAHSSKSLFFLSPQGQKRKGQERNAYHTLRTTSTGRRITYLMQHHLKTHLFFVKTLQEVSSSLPIASVKKEKKQPMNHTYSKANQVCQQCSQYRKNPDVGSSFCRLTHSRRKRSDYFIMVREQESKGQQHLLQASITEVRTTAEL